MRGRWRGRYGSFLSIIIIIIVQKLVGVVSKLLNKSNKQSFEQTQRDRKRRQGSKKAGTRLLETLDNFALKSFNASLGIIKDDNVSKFNIVYKVTLQFCACICMYAATVVLSSFACSCLTYVLLLTHVYYEQGKANGR